MPRSYWLLNPAFRGCLAFVLVIGFVAYLAYRPANQASDQQAQQEHSYSQQKSNGNSEKAEISTFVSSEDTLAQWIMAFFGVVATGVSAWAVLLLKSTLEVTQDAVAEAREATAAANKTADTTEKIGKAQVRAYLTCVGGDFRLTPDDELVCRIRVKNVGQSPASRITCYYYFEYPGSSWWRNDDTQDVYASIPSGITDTIEVWADARALSGHTFARVFAGETFRLRGHIEWFDVFDARQRIEFCAGPDGTETITGANQGPLTIKNIQPADTGDPTSK